MMNDELWRLNVYFFLRWNDKCVKLVERKGSDVMVTRDCLSSIESFRTDIPAGVDQININQSSYNDNYNLGFTTKNTIYCIW